MIQTKKLAGWIGLAVCALCCATGPVHAATSYSVVILGAPGSAAYGVSDGQVAGEALPPLGSQYPVPQAVLWVGSQHNIVYLYRSGTPNYSQANGVSNGQEVGTVTVGLSYDAFLWSESAASAVRLTPSGFVASEALGIYNGQEVGSANLPPGPMGYRFGASHAILWSGSATNAVDLNPSWAADSFAAALDSGQQVGWGSAVPGNANAHAVLWTGSAQSALDLNPSGFVASQATGVSNGQQVGFGSMNSSLALTHALLWNGLAAGAIDLNPTGFSSSEALAISNGVELGFADSDAALWTGSAASFVNLQKFLPGQFTSSEATGIDAEGDIVGFANTGSGSQAVMWIPTTIPLPAAAWMALTTLGLIAGAFLADRRGWRKGHCRKAAAIPIAGTWLFSSK